MNFIIDLHGCRACEAKIKINDFVYYWLSKKTEEKQQLIVITGWGRHSPNNIPVLKPMFLEIMRNRDIKVEQVNKGCFKIEI